MWFQKKKSTPPWSWLGFIVAVIAVVFGVVVVAGIGGLLLQAMVMGIALVSTHFVSIAILCVLGITVYACSVTLGKEYSPYRD